MFKVVKLSALGPWYTFGTRTRNPSLPLSLLSLHLRPLNSCIIAKLCDPTRPSLPSPSHLPPPSSPLFQSRNEQVGDFHLALENEFKAAGSIRVDLRVISGQSEINSAGRSVSVRVSAQSRRDSREGLDCVTHTHTMSSIFISRARGSFSAI